MEWLDSEAMSILLACIFNCRFNKSLVSILGRDGMYAAHSSQQLTYPSAPVETPRIGTGSPHVRHELQNSAAAKS